MCKENNECVLEDSIISVNVSDELCTNFSLPKKSSYGWAFSYRYGKMSMGDERCLNEGSWIVES